ncbi:MAG: nickel-dependent lactate racemase [Synergistaceae bacterium]|nr:nickel-dependent lactate racemase [Synergistaceae bacterium]
MNYTEIDFPVGKGFVRAHVPNLMAVAAPKKVRGVPDERAEVKRALKNPIGTRMLSEIAQGRKNAAIVVNDITRPYPGALLVDEIANELTLAGLKDEDIFLIVAYGTHRVNSDDEIKGMFGEEITTRFRIIHHKGSDEDTLITLGKTERGIPVTVNREYLNADVKILTGLITPHHSAGFSGGRKSVLPGISGLETLKIHHSFPFRPTRPSMGWIKDNPFHEEALSAARMAGVDFIINTIDNPSRELVAAVAGELNDAHMEGVRICKDIWSFELPSKADVVIVSPGGYPRDFDLHQSQKACACAELACREGGEIILCAEATDGPGKFAKLLMDANDPQEVIDKYAREGFTAEVTSKAYMYARAMKSHKIGLACSMVSDDTARNMFMTPYRTIDDGIKDAMDIYGETASFLAIPYAADIILTHSGEESLL